MRRRAGFTLLELIIAVAIFSLASVGMYAVFHAGMKSYKRMNGSFEAAYRARMVMARVEMDIKNSFEYAGMNSGFTGDSSRLGFFSVLDMYRNGSRRTEACRIGYRYENGVLYRSCGAGAGAIDPRATVIPEKLADGIKEFGFSYAGKAGSGQGRYGWASKWPDPGRPEEEAARPPAVAVRLIIYDGYNDVEFSKTFHIKEGQKIG
jgi:type II secretion system protein J